MHTNFLFGYPITLAKIYFSHVVIKPRKNISVLACTAVKKSDFLGPSPDAQNVCAVANVVTVLKCPGGELNGVKTKIAELCLTFCFEMNWQSIIGMNCQSVRIRPTITYTCLFNTTE